MLFNPESRVLHHFICRSKCVTGYPGLRVNSAWPFLLCTSLRDDRQSFLRIFVPTSTLDWISGWIYYNLWWNLPLFSAWLMWQGQLCLPHIRNFPYAVPDQQQTSTWRKYGDWSHSSATPKTPQPPPWSPHAPVTRWDLHGPPPCSQARWDGHTLSTEIPPTNPNPASTGDLGICCISPHHRPFTPFRKHCL